MKIKRLFANLALLSVAAILYATAFPNIIYKWGFSFLAYFCLIPVVLLLKRISVRASFFYGVIYGVTSYGLFSNWVVNFDPFALFLVMLGGGLFCTFLFPALKIIDLHFPQYGYVFQAIVYTIYEYSRTIGFIGYPYCILGYSQFQNVYLIGIARITGVLGVSCLVAVGSLLAGHCLHSVLKNEKQILSTLKKWLVPALIYILAVISIVIVNYSIRADYSTSQKIKIGLIQHNVDIWKPGRSRDLIFKAINMAIQQSKQALLSKPDIIFWAEETVVPPIRDLLHYRDDKDMLRVIDDLLEFIKAQKIPFVIGNNDLTRRGDSNAESNSALLVDNREIKQIYKKLHLVPFGEYFPLEKMFPEFKTWLIQRGAFFYEPGDVRTVFDLSTYKFSVMICYDDGFGTDVRNFVNKGAEFLVVMSHDSWAKQAAAAYIHLSMSVFRAVENARVVARATTGGITCIINPDGKITNRIPEFTADYIVADIPVIRNSMTFYTTYGDYFILAICVILVIGIFLKIVTSLRIHSHKP